MNGQFAFMPPWWGWPGGASQPSPQSDTAPAVVRAALAFVVECTQKTGVRLGISEQHGLESHDGQDLAEGEVQARDAAAEVLRKYFAGELQPPKADDGKWRGQVGTPMQCTSCSAAASHGEPFPRPSCTLCRGCGQIMIFPLHQGILFGTGGGP